MAYIPPNPNGQATSANSAPVVIASNQSAVPSNQTQINGVAVAAGSGASSTGTQRVILATDQPVIPANQTQVNGVAVAVGSGVNSTGTQRVTIATDQAAVASNQTQVNGIAVATGAGNSSTGTQRVVIATDDVNLAAINTATAAVNTKTPALGQATSVNSSPVVLSSAQEAILTNIEALINSQAGDAATTALTTTSIDAKTPALGRAAAASSSPIALCDEDVTDLIMTGQAAQSATVNNILTATAGASPTDVSKYRSFAIQVVSTATGGNFVIEGSNDGTNFINVPSHNVSLAGGAVVIGAIGGTASNIIYTGACLMRYIRLRINATLTGGSVQAFATFSATTYAPVSQAVGNNTATNLLATVTPTTAFNFAKAEDAVAASADILAAVAVVRNDLLTSNVSASGDYAAPTCDIYGNLVVKDQQRHKATYRTAFVVAPAATATDIFQLIGSASKTVEVTRIRITGTQITTGQVAFYIKKRSTANTGGTSSAATLVPLLSTDAAATAVGAIYTANPTTGTTVGDVAVRLVPIVAAASLGDQEVNIDFGERGRPLILSGVAQAMAINLNGVTITSGSLVITIEFTEY